MKKVNKSTTLVPALNLQVNNCQYSLIAVVGQHFVMGQLLDFSVPELVQSQSTFSADPEVLQNCAGFTLCSSAGLAVRECSAVMGLTPCMLRVACIGL